MTFTEAFTTASGARIRYRVMGDADRDLILVHGRRAHLQWWHAVTELLQERWRVIALDLSGHGDSDHRAKYTAREWVDEVRAVARAAATRAPTVVGHGMGGRIALAAAIEDPNDYRSVITLDTRLREESRRHTSGFPARVPRIVGTREEVASRFQLIPAQPDLPADILNPVVDYAIGPYASGWAWKFDPRQIPLVDTAHVEARLSELVVPWAFVYGERSALDPAESLRLLAVDPSPGGVEVIMLPGAHHHLVLDDPAAGAAVVDRLACAGQGLIG